MRSMMKLSIVALVLAIVPACAGKGFVRTEVGNVNSKVDTLSGSLEATQERTRQNETRIAAVDQKAESAGKAAETAGRSATEARSAADAAAVRANAVGTRVDTVAAGVSEANKEIADAKKLIYQVTLSEDQGNFEFGAKTLPDSARARIDQMVGQLKTDTTGIYIEIEGHTDNVGSKEGNQQLGLERAESVKRYLYEQHQVPLHKINVISYGEDKPLAPNNNRQGRAQNRRVVVRVLS